YLSGKRRTYRVGPAQARDPGHLLPLRLRAGRKPRRGGECRRTPDLAARLAADHLDRDRAQEGPGLGHEDDRDLPHPWNASGGSFHALTARWFAWRSINVLR